MIFLDDQTRPYLERLIDKQIAKSDKDFIAKRIKSMLKTDAKRLEGIANCKHKFGTYTGHKECCVYCGTHDEGMGESWSLKHIHD